MVTTAVFTGQIYLGSKPIANATGFDVPSCT